jgi:hypothetical protein
MGSGGDCLLEVSSRSTVDVGVGVVIVIVAVVGVVIVAVVGVVIGSMEEIHRDQSLGIVGQGYLL